MEKCLLSNEIIGLDKQLNLLEKLLLEFKENSQGGSCLLSGRRGTGKSLVVDEILNRHFASNDKKKGRQKDEEIRIEKLDGAAYENCFSATAKIFEQLGLNTLVENQRALEIGARAADETKKTKKAAQMPKILFIVDHFEVFARKSNQNFLYSILNGSQTYPWFVLLIGTTENCISNLEKRVRSRLSRLHINFNVPFTFEEFRDAFDQLLQSASFPKKLAKELEGQEKEVNGILERLHMRHNSIGWLKRLAQLYETVCGSIQAHSISAAQLLGLCLEALLPEDEQAPTLDALSVRQLCLLKCVALLEDRKACFQNSYREIATEYYRFTNENDKSMRVNALILYRDLDELVQMDLLVVTKKTDFGQLQFKKVAANADPQEINSAAIRRRQQIPSKILSWFNSGT